MVIGFGTYGLFFVTRKLTNQSNLLTSQKTDDVDTSQYVSNDLKEAAQITREMQTN